MIETIFIDPGILYALLGGFALLFAFSALEKYQDISAFQQTIRDYRLLPDFMAPVVAISIVSAEVIAATLLITQGYLWGVYLSIVVMSLYALGILINLMRGRTHIDCGCLGSRGEGISYYHVLRNLFLLSLLAICLLQTTDRALIWLDYLVIIITVAAFMCIYATMTLLIANHTQQRLWWSS